MNTSINYATFIVNLDKANRHSTAQTEDTIKYASEENRKYKIQDSTHGKKTYKTI